MGGGGCVGRDDEGCSVRFMRGLAPRLVNSRGGAEVAGEIAEGDLE